MRFDPQGLEPEISLNRLVLAGDDLPQVLQGRSAYELISSQALGKLAEARLNLAAEKAHAGFWARLWAGDDGARAIGEELGERLGWVLAALHQGTAAQRAARPEWDDAIWAHWAGIRRVVLGGGLAAQPLGDLIAQGAQARLRACGMDALWVEASPWAEELALAGLARLGAGLRLLSDFGGTRLKLGWAEDSARGVARLTLHPPALLGWDALLAGEERDAEQEGAIVADAMAAHLSAALQAHPDASAALAISVAAYVRDGQPLLAQRGIYMRLAHLAGRAEDEIAARVTAQSGRQVGVKLVHDGSAAALAYAGSAGTAVLMIGTALGVGFAPEDAGALHPLAPDFRVIAP